MDTSKRQEGFSLIELLIVVAIIGIIAAIAIPNLLASKRAANEASAIGSLRTMTGAEATYQSTIGAGDYGTLAQLTGQGLIDNVLGAGNKSGYNYAAAPLAFVAGGAPARFNLGAIPSLYGGIGATGTRSFHTNESGVIYFALAAAAPVADPTTRIVTPNTPLK